jgi:hypothetical protein
MRALCAFLLLCPLLAQAQFQGMDNRKKPPPVVVPRLPDYADGDRLIALPPSNDKGKFDLDAYKILYAALKERVGSRLANDVETLRAVERDVPAALLTADGQTVVADALRAQSFIVFTETARAMTAAYLPTPGAKATVEVLVDAPNGKVTQEKARRLVLDLMVKMAALPQPAAPAPAANATPASPAPAPGAPAPAPAAEEQPYEDVAAAAVTRNESGLLQRPVAPAGLYVYAGAGAAFRALIASGTIPVVPKSPDGMAAMGFALTVFPFRFLPTLKDSKVAELGIEGAYRYDLVRGDSQYNGVQSTCSALDDEMRGQLFYRYPLGGRLPKIGLGVGLWQQRTRFASACTAPALNTTYGATELQLKIQQPIFSDKLYVDLAGGPGILFSTRASNYGTRNWSLEGWVTARLIRYVAVRVGARFTQTRLTTWPEGVSLLDNRTFVGLELGATL